MNEKLLTIECVPGDVVFWKTLSGEKHVGILKEFDNGTAIVVVDGKEKAVRCI